PFEVDARAPLKPQALPIHFQRERDERLKTLNARFGLIRLFNAALGISLPVSTSTRVIRRLLEIQRLAEAPTLYRWFWRIWHCVALWLMAGTNIVHVAPAATRLMLGMGLAKH